MPRFACPHCQHILEVNEEMRGAVVSCRQCDRRIRVPAAKSTNKSAAQAVQPSSPLPPSRPRPKPATQTPLPIGPSKKSKPVAPTPPPVWDDADDQTETDENLPPVKPAAKSKRGEENEETEVEIEADNQSAKTKKKRQKGKKKSSAVAGTVSGIGGLIVLALFLFFLSGKWVDVFGDSLKNALEAQGIPPLVAMIITAAVLLIPLGLFYVYSTKSTILEAMPDDIDFRPTTPGDFPHLDVAKLQEYTTALDDLGFEHLIDYQAVTDLDNGITGFARLFFHEKKQCYAEINQGFQGDSESFPCRCSLMSHLDDGWSVSTSDRKATKENYLIRRPKAIWQSFPAKEPGDLLKAHLKLRKNMAEDLEVEVEADGSTANYFAHEKEANEARKEAVQRRNAIVIALEMWLFDMNPKKEWLGLYAKKRGKK